MCRQMCLLMNVANFLYDEPDGSKSFGAEFLEFEHDTFVQICRELELDYNKVKGGVLVYSQVTPITVRVATLPSQ